ncbi:MAG: hypothetical protein ACREX8_11935 [Gammaproteobacteria bacterium]
MTLGRPGRTDLGFRGSLHPGVLLLFVLALTATACGTTESPEAEVGSEGRTKTITHEYGEIEVPTDPERVAVLHTGTILGTALLLDVPIVAYQREEFGDGVLPLPRTSSPAAACKPRTRSSTISNASCWTTRSDA